MIFLILLFGSLLDNTVHSYETDSSRIEIAPLYDTIIFSDVADIMNEFETPMNNPLDALISGSDSDENVEDLLVEYQKYLEKAHQQRINYFEKTKIKNKVPLIRHERYGKMKPGFPLKYGNSYYDSYYDPSKVVKSSFSDPLDFFIPIGPKLSLYNNNESVATAPSAIDLNSSDTKLKEHCYCKNGQYPCDCKCKQCFVSYEPKHQSNIQRTILSSDAENKPSIQNSRHFADDKSHDTEDNTFNIRVKVDIQLPKMQEFQGKLFKNRSRDEDSNSKESAHNLPSPYFNIPIPSDFFGYSKTSKYNKHFSPLHKITIHKKKKAKQSNSNKRHRKKLVTYHNLNIEPQQINQKQPNVAESYNHESSDYNQNLVNSQSQTTETNVKYNATEKAVFNINYTNVIVNKPNEAANKTQTERSIYLSLNISNNSDNGKEESHKIENSVETDYPKIEFNIVTEKLSEIRRKRDTLTETNETFPENSTTKITPSELTATYPNSQTSIVIKPKDTNAKTKNVSEKHTKTKKSALIEDIELLYWPNNTKNHSNIISKNITTIILDRENQKTKLNMTKETMIHNNRTRILEKAIFGDVNWDDVGTVTPVFMSFVGKYIRGALTFCSQNICHSMKCAEKACVHRICEPNDRWNQRGHCAGSNYTDSAASLESIMDLPSNVVFEVVDILQNKMLGKVFGKVTLCISTKCISFVASKKTFLKSKCSIKDLNEMGHCSNMKNVKIM